MAWADFIKSWKRGDFKRKKNNSDNKTLFLAGAYNKAYLFDISERGKTKQIWKNLNLVGMKSGATARFSEDGKYILMRGIFSSSTKIRTVQFSSRPKSWQGKDDVCVLDASNGKVLFNSSNAYAISIANNTLFISDEEGFKFISLPEGKLIKNVALEDNEYAAISPSGKYIVMSWDADKKRF
jgi:hypothetical protein